MAHKTVLITGANRGIGFALTEHYKKEGWNVISCARNVDSADEVHPPVVLALSCSLLRLALSCS